MTTLFLTGEEQSLFDALSDALKEGWDTKTETLRFEDNAQRRKIRLEMLKVHHPKTQDLIKRILGAKTEQEIDALLESVNPKEIDDADLAELLFASGPDGIGAMVKGALKTAENDEDVAFAAQLSQARHELLESLQNFSS